MIEQKYYGIYQGIVTSTKDPEKRGRIKCLIPEVIDDEIESAWCEPCVPVAYDDGGDFYLPPKNEAVWVAFIAGDVDQPVWFGGWWQEKMTPFADDYSEATSTRIISYANCKIVMKDDKIRITVGDNESILEIEDSKITVHGNLNVLGDLNVSGQIIN